MGSRRGRGWRLRSGRLWGLLWWVFGGWGGGGRFGFEVGGLGGRREEKMKKGRVAWRLEILRGQGVR